MKCVCISCFDYYSTRMKSIIKYFSDKGFDTHYLITNFQHFEKKRYQVNYEECQTIQIDVPKYNRNLSMQRLISHHIFAKKVKKYIEDVSPDVIYCMFPPNSLIKELSVYKDQGKTVIFDCYDMWPESFPTKNIEKWLALPFKLWRNLRDRYIEKSDLVICVSEEGKSLITKIHPNLNVKILRPAISDETELQYDFDTSQEISFCYLGNINYITDTSLGVELLSMIAQKKSVVLHIIGEGQNKDQFVKELEGVGVKVVSHGVIFDWNEKNSIFQSCDLGLNIPKDEIQSSMSLKSIEYMHAGLPFVNSGIGDTHTIVVNQGIGINIDQNNVEKTVSEILSLSSSDLMSMSKKCRNTYIDMFVNQDLDEILSEYINMR